MPRWCHVKHRRPISQRSMVKTVNLFWKLTENLLSIIWSSPQSAASGIYNSCSRMNLWRVRLRFPKLIKSTPPWPRVFNWPKSPRSLGLSDEISDGISHNFLIYFVCRNTVQWGGTIYHLTVSLDRSLWGRWPQSLFDLAEISFFDTQVTSLKFNKKKLGICHTNLRWEILI